MLYRRRLPGTVDVSLYVNERSSLGFGRRTSSSPRPIASSISDILPWPLKLPRSVTYPNRLASVRPAWTVSACTFRDSFRLLMPLASPPLYTQRPPLSSLFRVHRQSPSKSPPWGEPPFSYSHNDTNPRPAPPPLHDSRSPSLSRVTILGRPRTGSPPLTSWGPTGWPQAEGERGEKRLRGIRASTLCPCKPRKTWIYLCFSGVTVPTPSISGIITLDQQAPASRRTS